MKLKFDVTGMTCSACSAHVERAVGKVKGVNSVSVSLLTNSMIVEYDDKRTDVRAIVAAVKKAGYGASPITDGAEPVKPRAAEGTVGLARLIVSAVFCVLLMYVSMGHMVGLPLPPQLSGHDNAVPFALTQLLLCLPVWYVNRSYFIVGFKRLFTRAPNMDSLIAVGSTAAAVYGVVTIYGMCYAMQRGDAAKLAQLHEQLYFESSAMILALVDLGKYFEGRSKRKTGDALAKLRKLAPDTAVLYVDGEQRDVDSKSVKVGDIVVVKAGMAFPADGEVVFGSAYVDESSVSGESVPVDKAVGSFVIGGTVNTGGYVRVKVTTVGSDSVLQQIISLVEEAGSSKAPIQRLADKIAGVFVPAVMLISLVTLIVWLCVGESIATALNFAVSVLVISCPCALGLATPVAIMVATGKGAENGILVKNGEILERLADIKQVVLDKTGTVTFGKPTVRRFEAGLDEAAFFAIAAGIEKQSEHPLGKAVVSYAQQNNLPVREPQQFETVVGCGVVATLDGKQYALGNRRLMERSGVDPSQYEPILAEMSSQALTCLLLACDGAFVGAIGVGDEVKDTSGEAVALMKGMGVKPVLLTGDNAVSAKAVCDEVGIDEFFAEVLPDQKERKIRDMLPGGVTAMVGDGINDAPALARADVGIAVACGSDIAIDSADVLLLKNDLRDVATAIQLSKKTKRNIKQNLFWAFFYNCLGIPLAAGVLYATPLHLQLSPMIAAAAMSLSSLFVVTNALRLRLFKPNRKVGKAAAATPVQAASEVTMTYILSIEGMMCDHCVEHVTKALSSVRGVESVSVDLAAKSAVVKANKRVKSAALVKAVEKQGYKVMEVTEQ